jgi:hypothetical protein
VIAISEIVFFINYLKLKLEFFKIFNNFIFINFGLSTLKDLVLIVDLLNKFFFLALILFFRKSLLIYIRNIIKNIYLIIPGKYIYI